MYDSGIDDFLCGESLQDIDQSSDMIRVGMGPDDKFQILDILISKVVDNSISPSPFPGINQDILGRHFDINGIPLPNIDKMDFYCIRRILAGSPAAVQYSGIAQQTVNSQKQQYDQNLWKSDPVFLSFCHGIRPFRLALHRLSCFLRCMPCPFRPHGSHTFLLHSSPIKYCFPNASIL